MKHLFIVNPVAGGRDRTLDIQKAAGEIFKSCEDFEVYSTRAPMDAIEKIRAEAAVSDKLRVYAVGGDGTLNECINGAAGMGHVAVSIYPSGTGNDFVRMFGDEKKRFSDIRELIYGEVRPIDIIECGGRYGINICSVGIDARIGAQVHDFSRIPVLGGKFAYISSTVANFARGINQQMRIKVGENELDGNFALVCACNGRFYGGGFNPVPEARPDDGVLDFLIIREVPRLMFIRLIGKYAKGKYRELPEKYVTHFRGEAITIESDLTMCINIDGENLESKKVEFKLIPCGVDFIFPRGMSFFDYEHEKKPENKSKSAISQ